MSAGRRWSATPRSVTKERSPVVAISAARRGVRTGLLDCVNGDVLGAQGGDEAAAEAIAADGADEGRRATQRSEGAGAVGRRAARAKPDFAGHVRARLQRRAGAHDDIEHQVAEANEARLFHGGRAMICPRNAAQFAAGLVWMTMTEQTLNSAAEKLDQERPPGLA